MILLSNYKIKSCDCEIFTPITRQICILFSHPWQKQASMQKLQMMEALLSEIPDDVKHTLTEIFGGGIDTRGATMDQHNICYTGEVCKIKSSLMYQNNVQSRVNNKDRVEESVFISISSVLFTTVHNDI